ncbi:MAG: hypothetical protein HeimC2_26310 [Candidatus Heimdallarchaeota archaeon LC_2]|nr:MAG: hypothetical protein HeimC2_26310 [Candidatus Heimdallarchaeota archaeon LC_2]
MNTEKNLEVVKQYYVARNTKNWESLLSLFHDEYPMDRSSSAALGDYVTEITEAGINPGIQFFQLLGYDDKIITEAQNFLLSVIDKQSNVNYLKWRSQFISNFEIQDVMVDKNRVWVYVNSVVLTSYHRELNFSGFQQFVFKESKITASYRAGRYLGSVIQMGKVIMAANDKEEINNYLQVLRNLGILPNNIDN